MGQPHILAVDDEPVALDALVCTLEQEGFLITTARSGEQAWRLIAAQPEGFDVVILDRMMPDIDGIEILRRMKEQSVLAHTPVIMQTAMTAESDITAGLAAGAYYYLTKPFAAETLIAIVNAALGDGREYRELRDGMLGAVKSLAFLDHAEFSYHTTEEARAIATLIAQVAPEPDQLVVGLSELMLNAVEHGNLAITYEEKTELIGRGELHGEIVRRLALPEYQDRVASLEFIRLAGELRFIIRDDGAGFDWRRFLEISPDRAFDTHGRGIAMARMISFDSLEYRGSGSEVVAVVRCG
jgi:DNA-binding response OmpR family regulator